MDREIKNIWIFCHYAQQPPYNTMLRYHNWGKQLVQRGYNVTIVAASTVHNTDIDVIDKINRDEDICCGVHYRYLHTSRYSGNGMGRMKNMLQFGMKLKYMRKEEQQPDVIIVCEAYLYLFARKFFKKIPIITEYSGVSKYNPLIQVLYWIEKKAYINTDALIFSMEGGKDYVSERRYQKQVDPNKIFHINMGIDIKETDDNKSKIIFELPWNMNQKNIVYIGSIRKANNVQQICDAALELKNRGVENVCFQIYGNGDELNQLMEYVKEKSIDNVKFYGRIEKEKIPYILEHATANILTYKQVNLMKYGGSQSKLFDYLASGKPIICNAKFGYNLIERYNCGIVTQNQSSTAFADTVEKICRYSSDKLELMGQQARKAAEDYDQPALVDKLCEVFKFVLE